MQIDSTSAARGLSAFLEHYDKKCLVMVAQDLAHWSVGEVAAGAGHAALSNGYRLISLDFHRSFDREQELLKTIGGSQVDGCIFLWDHSPLNLGLYTKLVSKFPCVQVVDPKPITQLDCVLCDDYAGAMSALHHLLRLGYRQIGHLSLDTPLQPVRDRRQAYLNMLQQAELPIEENWLLELPYGLTEADRVRRQPEIRKFLTQPRLPRALFICADWLASEVIECIQELGLNIPKDIALIGYDDALPYALTGIPLSTVQNDFRQIGRLAVERLIFRIQNRAHAIEPCTIRISPMLVIRASSVQLTPTTERWDFVMRYIQDHFREELSLRQVADVLGVNPSYFSHHFRQVFGMRFTELVNQLRLEYAAQLLLTTDDTIATIVGVSGFQSLNNFYTVFKRNYGLSPNIYRRQQNFR